MTARLQSSKKPTALNGTSHRSSVDTGRRVRSETVMGEGEGRERTIDRLPFSMHLINNLSEGTGPFLVCNVDDDVRVTRNA